MTCGIYKLDFLNTSKVYIGQSVNIENAYKFAKQNGLAPNHFQEVLNGHRKSHKGWKLCHEEQV